jgi:hypothetical protein
MASQDFDRIRGPLLELMEDAVVDEHAGLHRDLLQEEWSPSRAYKWMRYENPAPAHQLSLAVDRLDDEWQQASGHPEYRSVRDEADAIAHGRVEQALALGVRLGFTPA